MHGGLKFKTCSESISISLATFDGYTWDKIQELQDKARYDEAQTILKE